MLQNQFPPPKQRGNDVITISVKTQQAPPLEQSHHKKLYLHNEQVRRIDRENQMLFLKILDISTKPTRSHSTTNANTPIKTTLNLKTRKDFQEKIAFENQKIYARIKQQTSLYTMPKQPKSLSKQRVNSSFVPQRKATAECLYSGGMKQNNLEYKIKVQVEGGLFKILANTEEQSYTRVLEMTRSDGLLLLKNVFNNEICKLIANLIIGDKITIKGIELIEGHGNF